MTTHNQDQAQHAPNPQYPQRSVQTLARAYAEIVAQTSPWVALNEFFHEWWDYSRMDRAQLIAEEVPPGGPSALLAAALNVSPRKLRLRERDRRWRWAVFCAAVADYLSAREGITPPAWVTDPRYTLDVPWYVVGTADAGSTDDTGDTGDDEKAPPPKKRLYLEQTTPPQLRRRNIFCSDRIFANKYEFTQHIRQLVAARANQATQTASSTAPRMEKPTKTGE